jgi:hypothetical protein
MDDWSIRVHTEDLSGHGNLLVSPFLTIGMAWSLSPVV